MAGSHDSPLISIIIPCYNAGRFLDQCLKSVVDQTYPRKELILVDDCSTDDSYSIAKGYAARYNWIKVHQNDTNLGVAESFNRGIRESKGLYLARMDADDVMLPDRIDKQITYLLQHPDVVIVGGQCQIIDQDGHVTGQKLFPTTNTQIKAMLFTTVPMQQPTIMINRSLIPEGVLISKKRFSPAEDYDFFFSLSRFGKLANLKDFTLKYREHTTNISLTKPKHTFWRIQDARVYAIRHYGYRPTPKALLIVILQTIAITLLPSSLIYPLHKLTRRMNRP